MELYDKWKIHLPLLSPSRIRYIFSQVQQQLEVTSGTT
jgi:hypothetical protein